MNGTQFKTHSGRLVENVVNQMAAGLAALDSKLAEIETAQASLKEAGVIFASTHWREGKYLYLIYPSRKGVPRKRQYIGTDPQRIKHTLDCIHRARQYEALIQGAEQYRAALSEIALRLDGLVPNRSRFDVSSQPGLTERCQPL